MTPTKKLIERAKKIVGLQLGSSLNLRAIEELIEHLERYERALEKCKEQKVEWSKLGNAFMKNSEIENDLQTEERELEAILNPQEKREM